METPETAATQQQEFVEFCCSLETYATLEEFSRAVIDWTVATFRAERGALFVELDGTLTSGASVNLSGAALLGVGEALKRFFAAERERREPVVMPDEKTSSQPRNEVEFAAFDALNAVGASQSLFVPLHFNGKIGGALYFDTTIPTHAFTPRRRFLLKTLSYVVATRLHALTGPYDSTEKKHAALSEHTGTEDEYSLLSIVGRSPRLQSLLVKISQVAGMNIPVLIEGESGTGKELIARALHLNSDRRDKPFVAINCGAIPEQLLSSELFGYERGAFTDAKRSTPGKFEVADGGTLFLDEVAELPPAIQVALLRVLQSGEFFRLGSAVARSSGARIVAATNKRLVDCVHNQTFRQDLYYRLNVVRVTVPPLRQRREDIPLLVAHFLKRINIATGKDIRRLSPEAFALLHSYNFPGNVRELENVIGSAAVSAMDAVITAEDLPEEIRFGGGAAEEEKVSAPQTFQEMRAEQARVERAFLERLLSIANGNVTRAAQDSGINRTQLHSMCVKHNIQPASFRRGKE